ncbi:hypothetical protein [Sphingomonas sp.]|uniref:hypothetical protein n=1 Tax=Sphingomonas sp. TaxID=28214 RepID=UPI002DE69993|nr:hypothetical protein [Sphingomonas sp.]
MLHLTRKRFSEASKRLKRILQDDFGEATRLNHCQKALAEGLDFGNLQELSIAIPTGTFWNREWCIYHLVEEGYVSSADVAEEALIALEKRLPWLSHNPPEEEHGNGVDNLQSVLPP